MLCVLVCIGTTGDLTGCFTLLMVFALSLVLAARLLDLCSCEPVKDFPLVYMHKYSFTDV